MPASKKDLRKLKQKQNVANGVGDKDGKTPSQVKVRVGVFRLRVRVGVNFFAEFLTNEKAAHH